LVQGDFPVLIVLRGSKEIRIRRKGKGKEGQNGHRKWNK
jgi:hypothetical protein